MAYLYMFQQVSCTAVKCHRLRRMFFADHYHVVFKIKDGKQGQEYSTVSTVSDIAYKHLVPEL